MDKLCAVVWFCLCAVTLVSAKPILDKSDENRLALAFKVIDSIHIEWALPKEKEPAVLLFGENEEWLVNSRKAPGKPFVKVARTFRNKAYYHSQRPISLLSKYLPYAKYKQVLVGQAFCTEGPFIEEPWFVISRLDDLIRNHPGFNECTPTEEWISIFIHEYFHLLQLNHRSVSRFMVSKAKNGPFVRQVALENFYRKHALFRATVEYEHELLKAALTKGDKLDIKTAIQTLTRWLDIYRSRISTFSGRFSCANAQRSLADFDAYWMFIEGLARYVESQVLINSSYHTEADDLDDERFSCFVDWAGKGYNGLPAANRRCGRRFYYAIGMHVAFLLDIAAPGWKTKVFSKRRWLVGMVEELTKEQTLTH